VSCPFCDEDKRAPVQGFAEGIPWSLHMKAYNVYAKRYGKQEALITGRCRGGFGVSELDEFIPGWREELSALTILRNQLQASQQREADKDARIAELEGEVERLRDAVQDVICDPTCTPNQWTMAKLQAVRGEPIDGGKYVVVERVAYLAATKDTPPTTEAIDG
jgi:hypothetical protein